MGAIKKGNTFCVNIDKQNLFAPFKESFKKVDNYLKSS